MKNLLIIDDDPDFQEQVKIALYSLDVNPITALSGSEAVSILQKKEENIDLILLDIMMPGMDGIITLRKINEKTENPFTVIMVSSRKTIEDLLLTKKYGAQEYITKPVKNEILKEKIKKYL